MSKLNKIDYNHSSWYSFIAHIDKIPVIIDMQKLWSKHPFLHSLVTRNKDYSIESAKELVNKFTIGK